MELLVGTVVLRPYVFGFVAAFVAAGCRDLGARRKIVFGACVWPLAWVAEFSSTRIGIPFGLYHYTGTTRGLEIFIADVPFMDSLSFVFLAYAAFCLARAALGPRRVSRTTVALFAGALMMLLDVVIDPLAVRGDRWFLGRIFYYPNSGAYFGVPLSNFLGWWVVGALGVGSYLWIVRDGRGREPLPGVALYYAVAVFNLVVTSWIGEWRLVLAGLGLHAALGAGLRHLNQTAEVQVGLAQREVQRA